MTYIIWKDPLFYIYLILFIGSAVVFVNSLRDYLDLEKEEVQKESDKEYDSEEVNETISDEEKDLEKIVISHSDDEVVIKKEKENENIEKIEFNDSPLFSSSSADDKSEKNKEPSPAVEFLMNINLSLEKILSEIDLNNKRILDIEKKVFESELSKINDITKRIDNIEEKINEIFLKIDKSFSNPSVSLNKTTPRYIFKYLQDIVDDFDNIEKEVIKKRLSLIISEVEKEIDKND
jgi:hypothetical protein